MSHDFARSQAVSTRSPHPLARLLGGFVEPLRASDLLSEDHPHRPHPPVHRWRYNAAVRALVFFLIAVAITGLIAAAVGVGWVLLRPEVPFPSSSPYLSALAIPGFVAAYLVLALVIEKRRPPVELAARRAGGLWSGLALGVVLQLLCVGVLWAAGAYRVHGFDPAYNPLPMLVAAGFGAAINEEIVFRGILYRLLEETFGTWAAVAVSGLVFGLAHLTNPHASLQGALAIALQAGILFAALYALTRSLWVVIGLHFAWNVVQGPLLGIVVSGTAGEGRGYVRSTLEGPDWLAGGGFGMEASLVTVLILTALAVWLLVIIQRRGLAVAPFWVRRRRLSTGVTGATAP